MIGPNIITENLILYLDARNPKSYPGSGINLSDISGLGGSGQFYNSPLYSQGSINFDGSNQFIRFERSDLNAGSFSYPYITVYIWVKPPTNGSTGGFTNNVFTIENTLEISFGRKTNGFSEIYYASNPWAWRGNSNDALINNEWNLITYVHSDDDRKMYVNANLIYTSGENGPLASGSTAYPYLTLMGRYDGTSSSLEADLATVSIYSEPHTLQQVQIYYDETKPRF